MFTRVRGLPARGAYCCRPPGSALSSPAAWYSWRRDLEEKEKRLAFQRAQTEKKKETQVAAAAGAEGPTWSPEGCCALLETPKLSEQEEFSQVYVIDFKITLLQLKNNLQRFDSGIWISKLDHMFTFLVDKWEAEKWLKWEILIVLSFVCPFTTSQ